MKKGVRKKYFYFLIGVFVFIFTSSVIYAQGLAKSHDAGEILITKNGYRMSLNEAKNNDFFSYDSNPDSNIYTDFIIKGHGADEIWVNVSGNKMTLQEALNRSLSEYDILCSGGSTENFIFGFGEVGHLGSEVEILVDGSPKILQKAINDGDLCGCRESYGQSCGEDDCMNPGVSNCDGNCIGTSLKDVGESCGSEKTCTSAGDCCITECGAGVCGEVDNGCGGTLTCGNLNAEVRCYDNDEYWYDSCGNRQEMKNDCGENIDHPILCDFFNLYSCESYDVTCYKLGCSGNSCYNNPYTKTVPANFECKGVDTGGTVISTELYSRGLLNEEDYNIEIKYAYENLSPEALRGYRVAGIPSVRAMRKNPDMIKIISPGMKLFIDEIVYRVKGEKAENKIRALYFDQAISLFERIGILIDEPDWQRLYGDSWIQIEIFPLTKIINNFLEKESENDKLVREYFTEKKVEEMAYNAWGEGNKSDLEIIYTFLEDLKKSVEEIEAMVERIN